MTKANRQQKSLKTSAGSIMYQPTIFWAFPAGWTGPDKRKDVKDGSSNTNIKSITTLGTSIFNSYVDILLHRAKTKIKTAPPPVPEEGLSF